MYRENFVKNLEYEKYNEFLKYSHYSVTRIEHLLEFPLRNKISPYNFIAQQRS